ncbi:MAG: hypothetical protein K5767_03565, partial [Clostridia bacterium]|nr:hypothetical protein [Clostridia bacterium]
MSEEFKDIQIYEETVPGDSGVVDQTAVRSDEQTGEREGTRRRFRGERSSLSMFMRLIRYFICFTVMLMAMIWILQVLFLQTFYQQMKIHQLYSLA